MKKNPRICALVAVRMKSKRSKEKQSGRIWRYRKRLIHMYIKLSRVIL